MSNDKQPLVIYHSPCLDGFTAAWAMWLKYPDAEFFPGIHGTPPPDVTGRDVYLLDFSYKRDVLCRMVQDVTGLTILDHHKSADAEVHNIWGCQPFDKPSKVNVIFDMNKSGARLAWEWFHRGIEVPLLVRLVEDRDLWRFALPDTRAVNATLFSYPYDFEFWNTFHTQLEDVGERSVVVAAGEAIERKQQKDIAELVPKLRHTLTFDSLIPSRVVPAVNLPYTLASDAGNLLAQGAPFAAVYYQDRDGYQFSLRSVEGGMDVSEVAVKYGGGGHKHAAGFRIRSLEEL